MTEAPREPPSSASPPRVAGSVGAFAICVAIGCAVGAGSYFALRATALHVDRVAFFVIGGFAVGHVAAILLFVPRLERRGFASLRSTVLTAAVVWSLAVATILIGKQIWSSYVARTEAAAKAAERDATDKALASGGFARVILDRPVPLLDIDHLGGLFVAVGGVQEGTILHSADFGQTWHRIDLPPHVNTLRRVRIVTPDRIHVLASTEGGPLLLTSRDRGATWTERPAPTDGREIACSTSAARCWVAGIDAGASLSIHRSDDGGVTWIAETTAPAPPAPQQYSTPRCGLSDEEAETLVCALATTDRNRGHGGYVLRRSVDGTGAVSWNRSTFFDPTLRKWSDIWVGTGGVVVAAGGTAAPPTEGTDVIKGSILVRSEDGGVTFTQGTLGLEAGSSPHAVDFIDDRTLLVIVGNSLVQSDDGGRTFTADSAIAAYAERGATYMRDLSFESPDRGVIIKENGSLLVRVPRADQ